MGALKALGIDGFHALFYQSWWSIIGNSLCSMVKDVFERGDLSHDINSINIVLLLKVDHPKYLSQFCPISLCNVRYKIITKVVANRLKSIIPKLISPMQCNLVLFRVVTSRTIVIA